MRGSSSTKRRGRASLMLTAPLSWLSSLSFSHYSSTMPRARRVVVCDGVKGLGLNEHTDIGNCIRAEG